MADGRPGPNRSEAARQAILQATAAQFVERGWTHLSIEGIAEAAGVGKQTIYRWWATKSAIIADCLFERILLPDAFAVPDTGDLRTDLRNWLADVLAQARDPQSLELFRSLITVAAEDENVGRHLYDTVGGGESMLTARLDAAVAAGQLPAGSPVREIAEVFVGAAVMRFIFRAPIDDDLPDRLVQSILGPTPR